ncbi:MAG: filamentous hemagglutinin N-terminal domain-containing protein [Cyanobacteria bacterium P01_G01_bin.54]
MRSASTALFTACLVGITPINPTLAQSITPAPDGTGTIINYNGNTYHITGGTQAGANLFHSFQQFGLQPSEIADFLSNPEISNVVGRVIGGDPSVIEGLIRLSGGNSNLFLVNPAGWVFTEGASVDVPGSFGVTTANRIGFGAGFFNAAGDNDYAALTGDPTSLMFDSSQPGAIINTADLNVSNGSLWMVGGSVISTGSITAPNGTVTLAAVPGESKVKLSHDGMTLSFFLDALAVDEVQAGTPLGIRAVDLPGFLNGSSEVGNANEVVKTENGELWLIGSQLRVEEGDVVVGNRVIAENVDLVAAGRVQVSDPSEIAGTTTVVRLPEADGPVSLNIIDRHADNADALLYGSAAGTIVALSRTMKMGLP